MLELNFEENCLQKLRSFVCWDYVGNKEQTVMDIRRVDVFTVKDQSEGTEWSYVKKETESQILGRQRMVEPDPAEVFFFRIQNLDSKLRDFIADYFHQGGIFFSARAFLAYHINSLGFKLGSEHQEHHLACELNPERLVVEEKFFVKKLTSIPPDMVQKIISENGKLSGESLSQAERENITYFQQYIKGLLTCGKFSTEIRLEKGPLNGELQIAPSDSCSNLIEFTVKHTIYSDPKASQGIKIKELSKEDVKVRTQPQLYALGSTIGHPAVFARLLLPDLSCVPYTLFKKPTLESRINHLIGRFLLLLLQMLSFFLPFSIKLPYFQEKRNDLLIARI